MPTGQTLDDLQNNWTLGESFSTFAYRISAVQKLGAVLELNRSLDCNLESQIETVDAHLASSLMSLPPLHGDGHDSSSHDEMIFQAQMILYLSVCLLLKRKPQANINYQSTDLPSPSTIQHAFCLLQHQPSYLLHPHKTNRRIRIRAYPYPEP